MYTGHFAAALVLKAKVPKAPSWALLVGACLLDFLFAVFVTVGVESWDRRGVQIGWSHSLVGALLWAVLFGGCFFQRGWIVCVAVGASVFSHFVLDWPVHAAHLPLYPHAALQFGLGLGQQAWGRGWWLELAVILAGSAYYLRRSAADRSFGRHGWWACGLLVALHIMRAVLHQ